MMPLLLSALLSIAALTIHPLPVRRQGETVLEAGSALLGRVKSVTRVGFGLRHETAGLDLEFNRITTPDGESIPISTQVAEVDNGRERVTRTAVFMAYAPPAASATESAAT
jgi:hypothetical protein